MVDTSICSKKSSQKNFRAYLSVVIPVYRSQDSLRELYERLKSSLSSISDNFEIILVNDASPDDSWMIIQDLAQNDSRVKGLNLSRNFGQHRAITAGLDFVNGEWIVVMDCDLQDIPEEIPKLYQAAITGYDLVVGRKIKRQDGFFKKFGSRCFYRAFSYFTDSKVDNRIGNFGIYTRKVIDNIKVLREQNRSFGLFAIFVGFRRLELDIEHASRAHGSSSYNIFRLILLATDSIIAHSNKLLLLAIKLGFLISFSSLCFATLLVMRYFFLGAPLAGWTSVMVSMYFATGLIIATIGVVGVYIGKVFDEVKGRPLYIVESTTFEGTDNHE